MKINKDLKELLEGFTLSEEDECPYLVNFMSKEKIFGIYGKNFYGYIRFLNDLLKSYFSYKRTESFQEFLDRLYPPKDEV